MADWSVPLASRAGYAEVFRVHDSTRSGFLTGPQARTVLLSSGLPQGVLAQIWNLSDVDVDGRLSLEEFILASYLIDVAKTGKPLPAALPPDLVPPSFRKPTTPSSRAGSISDASINPSDWSVPLASRTRYTDIFRLNDTTQSGFLTGVQARGIMVQSGLPQGILAQIWNLSDVDVDGRLSLEEFILASHLIDLAKSGKPMPVSLTPDLVPPSFRKPSAPTSRAGSLPDASIDPSILPPAVMLPDWAIPQPSKLKYTQVFNTQDLGRTGFLTGVQARGLMVQSGLPQGILAQIWNLSDIDVDGRLSLEEFILASHLIDVAKTGKALPQTLPPELVPPSYRKVSTPTSRTGSVSEVPMDPSIMPPSVMLTEWAVPQPSKLKYVQVFNTHDRNRTGFLTGVQARGIMVQSGLPQDVLAKIWNLCDATASGKLNSEEFVLAMHLIDLVKAGDTVPTALPPELVPPCHRRRRGSSTSSITVAPITAGVATPVVIDPNDSPGKVATFEDKRKENFERGQAVLDRKRQVLLDQQRREQEERERKEREEQAKREKIRLEMERKRQEEIERQLQKQREIEAEKEEARKAELEKREAARRELERQRLIEWETQRINELQIQKQKVIEYIASLKSRKTKLVIDIDTVNNQFTKAQEDLTEARNKVASGKSVIDSMRTERDAKLRELNLANATKKTLNEKQLYVERERERIMRELKAEVKMQADQAASGSDAAKLALQNKQAMIGQLKVQLKEAEEDKEQRQKDSDKTAEQLNEVRNELEELKAKVRELHSSYTSKLQQGKDVKDQYIKKQMEWSSKSVWDEPAPASVIVGAPSVTPAAEESTVSSNSNQEKIEYNVLFDFDATNDDELTLRVGDVVLVIPDSNADEGWLRGEFKGQVGWFPANYAEPVSGATVATSKSITSSTFDAPVTAAATTTATTQQQEQPVVVTSGETVTAIYGWEAKESNQISFKKGDVIKVTEKQDEWWLGELTNGQSGWFPMAFVQSPTATGQEDYYVTLYPFESQEPGDLGFEINEVVKVVKKDGEWWTGEISEKRVGVFPSNYVREAEPHEIPQSTNAPKEPTTPCPKPKGALEKKISAPLDKKKVAVAAKTSTDSPSKTKAKAKAKKPEIVVVVADYKATGPEQINLTKGQLIQVKKKNSTGWWEGETQMKGKKKEVGWFPATYVKPLSGATPGPGAPPSTRSTPEVSTVSTSAEKVISIYPFKAQHDDELSFEANEVIAIISKDDPTWWKGQIVSSGAIGLFPANHVQEYKFDIDSFPCDKSSSGSSKGSSPSVCIEERKRNQRITELIASEEDYIRDLTTVAVVFRDQLFSTRAITSSEKDTIFGNWDQLIQINKRLVESLHAAQRKSSQLLMMGQAIADGLKNIEYPYIYYCSRLLTAERAIEKKSEDSGYFVDQAKRFATDDRCNGLNLSAYLLTPLQRVTRYPLLIRKILESTESTHPDHKDIRNALNIAEKICASVNEGRRIYENHERLDWMQSHINLTDAEILIQFNSETRFMGQRELLHMGSLVKVNSSKELMAFLCIDFILFTIPTKEIGRVSNLFANERAMSTTYKVYKRPFFLDEVAVKQTISSPNHNANVANGNTNGNGNTFDHTDGPSPVSDPECFDLMIAVNPNEKKQVTFRAISVNDKIYWIQKLNQAMKAYREAKATYRKIRGKQQASCVPTAIHANLTGRLLVTVTEATNLPIKHPSIHVFFTASLGPLKESLSTCNTASELFQREESPTIKCTFPHHRSSLPQILSLSSGSTSSGPSSFELLSGLSSGGTAKWEHAMRFLLYGQEDQSKTFLVVSVYERSPFSPNKLIGHSSLRVKDIKSQLQNAAPRPLIKQLALTSDLNSAGSLSAPQGVPAIHLKVDIM